MKIEDDLISYNTAVLAKEKGFNIYTQYYYGNNKKEYESDVALYNEILNRDGLERAEVRFHKNYPLWCAGLLDDGTVYGYNRGTSENIMFPTQSLLKKWLRKVHNIDINVCRYTSADHQSTSIEIGDYYWEIVTKDQFIEYNPNLHEDDIVLEKYEDYLEGALFEALKLLK